MPLQLEPPVRIYKEYEQGRNYDRLSKIFADKREPMFMADIAQRRLDVRNDPLLDCVCDNWWNNSFYVGDLWLRNAQTKEGKIICYSVESLELLRQINSHSIFENKCALRIDTLFFERIEGLGLTEREIETLHKRGYLPQEAVQSREWQYLLGGKERLEEYVEAVVKRTSKRNSLMSLQFRDITTVFTARPWFLNINSDTASANSNGSFCDYVGRFIGIPSNMHVACDR